MRTKRKIIRIDEDRCTGCGKCIPNCPEGALQIVDGKARLISDLFCDGLGACVGTCPEGALTVAEAPAEPYDEMRVMANIVKAGEKTIAAHLKHLKQHDATDLYHQAIAYLREHDIPIPEPEDIPCTCSGSAARTLKPKPAEGAGLLEVPSSLGNWPVQLMLVPVNAPYLQGCDLLVAADCVLAALPTFHQQLLRGRVLLVGCPKLDDASFYRKKLAELFRSARPKSVTVAHMTVPCCFGMVQLVAQAIEAAGVEITFVEVVVNPEGKIVSNQGS